MNDAPVNDAPTPQARYQALADAIAGRPLPLAVADLDLIQTNARTLLARAGRLPIRLGSKSIRCTEIMRLVQQLDQRFRGLLCFSAREAAWLATQGFDDLLVAYPTVEPADLAAVAESPARIVLMVDEPAHIDALVAAARRFSVSFDVAIDVDMSSRFPAVHFGVRRSPIDTPQQALELARHIENSAAKVRLVGVMGYEAQIAGVQDDVPGKPIKNAMIRRMKRRSIAEIHERRQAVITALRAAGHDLEFVNGGGTGSLESTAADPCVTEAAAGSGLYSPVLFDHFRQFRHEPALYFALSAARIPCEGVVTCAGGGYVASGPSGADRLPRPFLPSGGKLIELEGAGEVQTPVQFPPDFKLPLGAPVFFRHAKAGELAEHFNHLLLMRDGRIVDEVPTYRGTGRCFF